MVIQTTSTRFLARCERHLPAPTRRQDPLQCHWRMLLVRLGARGNDARRSAVQHSWGFPHALLPPLQRDVGSHRHSPQQPSVPSGADEHACAESPAVRATSQGEAVAVANAVVLRHFEWEDRSEVRTLPRAHSQRRPGLRTRGPTQRAAAPSFAERLDRRPVREVSDQTLIVPWRQTLAPPVLSPHAFLASSTHWWAMSRRALVPLPLSTATRRGSTHRWMRPMASARIPDGRGTPPQQVPVCSASTSLHARTPFHCTSCECLQCSASCLLNVADWNTFSSRSTADLAANAQQRFRVRVASRPRRLRALPCRCRTVEHHAQDDAVLVEPLAALHEAVHERVDAVHEHELLRNVGIMAQCVEPAARI